MNSKCSFKSCPAQEGIVLVTSAGGHTGKPTIMALKKKGYVVHAGVRNVLKANDQLKDVNADSIVYLDLSDSNTIKDLLKSTMYEAVIVIPPGVENRGELGQSAIEAIAETSPQTRIVLLSIPTADTNAHNILFTKQFHQCEEALRSNKSVEHWVCVQFGFFFEDFFMAVNKPKVSGELLLSIGENGSFPVISLPEVGWCLATAATKTSYEVEGKTFLCTSPKAYTGKEFAQALTNGLGVDVKYVDISNDIDNVVANNVKNGWPEWEARGILDLYGLGKMGYLQPADGMKLLTGSEGMSLEELVEKYKDAF